MDYTNDREKIITILRKNLNDDKYFHSLMVEKTAIEYARLYGENEEKAGFAGLVHDITKCFDNIALAEKYGIKDYTSPKVLHAFCGAVYLEKENICRDKEILSAVKYHTTGKANMTLLEKIVYLADLTEPLRDFKGVEEMRALCKKDLDIAMAQSSADTIALLVKKNLPIDENTLMAYNYYIGYIKHKRK